MAHTSCKLTIFEGPDGSGKSTAAKAFASDAGARYVHFPALPLVTQGLARLYVEAMLPALLGYQDVVFDRCWLSEGPYGLVFREGQDRLGPASCRMLERLAMRCGAVVVRCDPGWDVVLASYLKRRHLEMLKDPVELAGVYECYHHLATDLPSVYFDYTVGHGALNYEALEAARYPCHPLNLSSAGNWGANVVLVGEAFGAVKDCDPLYQWPFASFSKVGCSQWLANQLERIAYCESGLLWVNADQPLAFLAELQPGHIVALGQTAASKLTELGLKFTSIGHPQYFKRFGGHLRYPLVNFLQDQL